MTELDHRGPIAGFYPSSWPVECGGPRRQKVVPGSGLELAGGERLESKTRQTNGWAVMLVQRDPGELYLLCGAGLEPGEVPPHRRGTGDSAGWIERIDPVSLETLSRSPDLPSGGWLWCGAILVHENGDLYTVNGRFVHRLDPACSLVREYELPTDGPHNGLLVMSDGNVITRNLGFRSDDECTFVVLNPDLEPVGDPLVIAERCMGRFSADRGPDGEFVYTTTPSEIRRLQYRDGELRLDPDWRRSYAVDPGHQSDAWDTTVADDSIWLMDMGRPMFWMPPGDAPQRAFRFSIDDADSSDVIEAFDAANAWNPGPPLFDPLRKVLIHYDSLNGGVVAHRVRRGTPPELLWRNEARNFAQMMVYEGTGELVIEDSAIPPGMGGTTDDFGVVVVDIETGTELGRADIGAPTVGMFFCPGFDRDFYATSVAGVVTRVYVA